jgi:hypothetical protein
LVALALGGGLSPIAFKNIFPHLSDGVTKRLKKKLDNTFRHCRKKDRLAIDNTRLSLKMLPKFYQNHLRSVLNANQYIAVLE